MPNLYVVEQGAKLSVEKQRLLVRRESELIAKVPLAHTGTVVIFGNISITTPAMKRLMNGGIDVVFLTYSGRYVGRLVGPLTKFGMLRRAQYDHFGNQDWQLKIAQAIIRGKINNMRTQLMRFYRRQPSLEMQSVIERLGELSARTHRTTKLNSTRGVEGSAAAAYFKVFRHMLTNDWTFEKRVRRPPTDPVNVLLSFGYTLLTHAVESTIAMVGLDPYIGVLHTIEYGRPSLALDLVEEFRTPIVDSVVLRCLNTGMITQADFSETDDPKRPMLLGEGGRRHFIQAYEKRMQTKIKHPITNEVMTYQRVIEVQTRILARCIREGQANYQPFEVR